MPLDYRVRGNDAFHGGPGMLIGIVRRLRPAFAAWQEFHADCGTQIAVAHALICVPALYLAFAALVRALRLPVPLAIQAGLAALLYGAILWRWPLGTGLVSMRRIAAVAALLSAAWLAASLLYDSSWDGTSYHLPGLIALSEGWNPFTATREPIQVDVQANGIWTVRAALYALTGSTEGAKVLNFALLAAAVLTLVPAWMEVRGRPLTLLELGLVYALAGCTVPLGQAFTFYVDGNVYECGLVLLGAMLLVGSRHRRAGLGLVAAGIVLITGAKVSGIYYGPATVAIAGLAIRGRITAPARVAALVVAALVVGTVAIGFRPYVTNVRDYGHLVELGPGHDIDRPDAFRDRLPPAMLAASLLSRSDTEPAPESKHPWSVRRRELVSMGVPDTRFGGFGPFFALEGLLALAVWGAAARRRPHWGLSDPAFIIAVGLAAMTAIFPEPWLARFAPFFWGVPIFLALGAHERSALSRRGAAIVLVLAMANGGVAFAGNLARTALGDYRMRALVSRLAAAHQEVTVVPVRYGGFAVTAAHRLAVAGIPVRVGDPQWTAKGGPRCENLTLQRERTSYCLPPPSD